MSGNIKITNKAMKNVWILHENNAPNIIIAETIGISPSSVSRIINIMSIAREGGDVDAIDPGNHLGIKAFAKEYFGIRSAEDKPIADEQKPTVNHDDFRTFAKM